MLQDILTQERTPDQKPRFFLHEEMIAWLSDNLSCVTTTVRQGSSALSVIHIEPYSDYKNVEYVNIPTGFSVESKCTIDGNPIGGTHVTQIDLSAYTKALHSLSSRVLFLEDAMRLNNHRIQEELAKVLNNEIELQKEIVELKKRLDEQA